MPSTSRVRSIFFFSISTQYENLGDRIINRELLALLRRRGSLVVGVDGVPPAFLRALELAPGEAVGRRRFWRDLLAAAWRQRWSSAAPRVHLVLNPGGIVVRSPLVRLPRDMALTAVHAGAAALGIRICRFGFSHAVEGRRAAFFERLRLRYAHALGPRDEVSRAGLRALGARRVVAFPDLAFAVKPSVGSCAESPDRTAPLVVSFRGDRDEPGEDTAARLSSLLDRIDPERRRRIAVVAQVAFDVAAAADLARRLGASGARLVEVAPAADDEAALLRLYERAEAVLSDRLHVLLLALSTGTPALALADEIRNRKIVALFRDLGLEDLLIGSDGSRIDRAPHKGPAFAARVARLFEEQRARADAALDAALGED